jgi:hypothetical protein
MKSYKVRIFYNAYFDMTVDAKNEEYARDIVNDHAMDYAEDAILSYDFAEIDEIEVFKHGV